jgi:cell division protein FtsL
MRGLVFILSSLLVISMAYWAYVENYQTRASIRRVVNLQKEIALERQAIAVLEAEWAYLNRPDRLRDLVDLNFADLQLIPLSARHFGDVSMVAYPAFETTDIQNPIALIAPETFP